MESYIRHYIDISHLRPKSVEYMDWLDLRYGFMGCDGFFSNNFRLTDPVLLSVF